MRTASPMLDVLRGAEATAGTGELTPGGIRWLDHPVPATQA